MPTSAGVGRYLELMQEAEVPSTLNDNQVRRYLNDRFAEEIPEVAIRDFMLTNLVLTNDDNRFRWRANVEVLLRDMKNLSVFPNFDGTEYLRDTLFISGANSPYIDWKRDEERIHQLFPFATLEIINNAGHWVHSDQPKLFVETCAKFLNCPKKQPTNSSYP